MLRGHSGLLNWILALLFLGICSLPALFLPGWLQLALLAGVLLHAAWEYWTWEEQVGRSADLRPLSRWDVDNYPAFRARLAEVSQQLGLRREPAWVVYRSELPSAMAVAGRRGMVLLSTGLLKLHPTEELLAVAGHELYHIRSGDIFPVMVGVTWMRWLSGFARILMPLPLLGAVGAALNLLLIPLDWLAGAVLGHRSRAEEYLADEAGALATSPESMAAALSRLEGAHRELYGKPEQAPRWSPLWITQQLHASHPVMEERIRVLQQSLRWGEMA